MKIATKTNKYGEKILRLNAFADVEVCLKRFPKRDHPMGGYNEIEYTFGDCFGVFKFSWLPVFVSNPCEVSIDIEPLRFDNRINGGLDFLFGVTVISRWFNFRFAISPFWTDDTLYFDNF